MKTLISILVLSFVLVGCGRPYSMYQSVERCGVAIPVAPNNTLAEGIADLSSDFTVTSSPGSATQTFTSTSNAGCSFQTINLIVQ